MRHMCEVINRLSTVIAQNLRVLFGGEFLICVAEDLFGFAPSDALVGDGDAILKG